MDENGTSDGPSDEGAELEHHEPDREEQAEQPRHMRHIVVDERDHLARGHAGSVGAVGQDHLGQRAHDAPRPRAQRRRAHRFLRRGRRRARPAAGCRGSATSGPAAAPAAAPTATARRRCAARVASASARGRAARRRRRWRAATSSSDSTYARSIFHELGIALAQEREDAGERVEDPRQHRRPRRQDQATIKLDVCLHCRDRAALDAAELGQGPAQRRDVGVTGVDRRRSRAPDR